MHWVRPPIPIEGRPEVRNSKLRVPGIVCPPTTHSIRSNAQGPDLLEPQRQPSPQRYIRSRNNYRKHIPKVYSCSTQGSTYARFEGVDAVSVGVHHRVQKHAAHHQALQGVFQRRARMQLQPALCACPTPSRMSPEPSLTQIRGSGAVCWARHMEVVEYGRRLQAHLSLRLDTQSLVEGS
jgi:hypothetical protein